MARRKHWAVDVLEGFGTGWDLMDRYQKDAVEKDAGEAYKNTAVTEGLSGQDTLKNFKDNYVQQPDGPTAAEYIQQNPSVFADTRKADYTLDGKTQATPFSDGQIEAARNNAAAKVYSEKGKFKEAGDLRLKAAQGGLADLNLKTATEADTFNTSMKTHATDYGNIGKDANGDALTPEALTDARAEKFQAMKTAALANPAAAKDWIPAIEDMKKQAISSHLASKAPGIDATNDQIIGYVKESAKVSAKFGDVMNPTELKAARDSISKMNKEGYMEALEAAQRGDLKEANRLWNSAGSMKGTLISLQPGKMSAEMGGMATQIATYRDSEGQTHTINVGDAIASAQTMKERVDMSTKIQDSASKKKSADADASRASSAAKTADASARKENLQATELELTQAGAQAYAKRAADPKATLTPIQQQGLDHVTATAAMARDTKDQYKVEGKEVTDLLGDPAVDAQGKPVLDPLTGRQMVNRNVKEEAKFFAWAKAQGIRDTNKALSLYMAEKGNANAAADSSLPKGVPAGSKLIGTSNGKPVYRAPDGKQYSEE